MAFKIPTGYERFASEVFARFRNLLDKNVFTGITKLTLREWESNFATDEERYLAAHLLDALILRTDPMVASTSQHVVEMVLPTILVELRHYMSQSIDEFVQSLSNGDTDLGLRFVAVDGNLLAAAPGKSGALLIRHFSRATNISKNLLLRPENMAQLQGDVKVLVFLDDCVGTGKQFGKFSTVYKLSELSERHTLIYIPFVAHPTGLEDLNKKYPFLHVTPVEVLGPQSDFFAERPSSPGIWNRDSTNTVADIKAFYSALMTRKGVTREPRFGLNLSLGFSFSTPNNTLKAYFSDQGSWKRLLVR
jgi:hypothetical protein